MLRFARRGGLFVKLFVYFVSLVAVVVLCGCGRIGYDPLDRGDGGGPDLTIDIDSAIDEGVDATVDADATIDADAASLDMASTAASIVVTPTSGLVTNEADGTTTFTIVLGAMPTADVVVDLTSSNTAEGTVSPASVTFTNADWNTAQTITVTGVDDGVRDGDVEYTVVTEPAVSADERYDSMNADDVSVTNLDNESPGVTVSRTSGLATTEAGGSNTFTVQLNVAPTADVTLTLASDTPTEATVSPMTVTFTTLTWATPQTITVTGVDDAVADGDAPFVIVTGDTTSTDVDYDSLSVPDVSGVNDDDEVAGILVMPTSGLGTTEAGGTATFTVVLTAQPTSAVSVALMSSDTTEGTVFPGLLSFTMGDWNVAQTVTVTGVDDFIADGSVVYTIVTMPASSTGAAYNGYDASDVTVTNTDNDMASIVVMPTSGLVTTEASGAATFTVVLSSQPTSSVIVTLMSNDATEGTISPALLTFTTMSWSTPQTVTITGVDDLAADGDIAYTIITDAAVSSDPAYSGLDPSDVSVTNTDDDTAGITVTPTSGLVTSEAGGTATFTVVLTSQPANDVVISLTSSDATEGTVSPASLTFTAGNWSVARTVTVTGIDDGLVDGDVAFSIITGAGVSSDLTYSGVNPSDVSVTNTDNDAVGVAVTPTSGLVTTEAGGTAAFTVVLTSQPAANVVISLTSSDTTEGTVSPASLTFTTGNWNVPRTVTVTGVDDSLVDDGDIAYTIVTGAAVSADVAYSGVDASDVSVTNIDNDRGITYFKASNTGADDSFGYLVALSTDGMTLAVSSYNEDSNATGIDGNQADNSMSAAGAVYVFRRSAGVWTQEAYIKASNTNAGDWFGLSVSLSADGATLAVGAFLEDSNAMGINGDQADNSIDGAGAVYVFRRTAGVWAQEAYVKASNTGSDLFGLSASLSADGTTLAVGAVTESSSATGIGGNQADNSTIQAGAAYVFRRTAGVWAQEAYVKASNSGLEDWFGSSISLSADGTALAVGARQESGGAMGVNGNDADNSVPYAGAVYVFRRTLGVWAQEAYVKASNPDVQDFFGQALALSADGMTLAVGVTQEDSSATGINGNQADNSMDLAGAVYVFRRTAGVWAQEAYVKASNTNAGDSFGGSISLSSDGASLAVGAFRERSNATGIGGDQANNSIVAAGAVYVFSRTAGVWAQARYVKAPNTGAGDGFGAAVSLSADGTMLAVGADGEDSSATGVNGNQADNSIVQSGAAYLYE
jgi:hypothetical protein